MRAISRAIDRFCAKHRKFGIPRLMRYIVFISAVVFIISFMDTTGQFIPMLGFDPRLIMRGQVWRIVTWVFLPIQSNPFFTVIALYFYFFIGESIGREWGTAKFTVYYCLGIALNIIYGFVSWFILTSSMNPTLVERLPVVSMLSPLYLNLSLFFAFAALFPDHRLMLFFIIPIKVKWLALANACLFAYSIISDLIGGSTVLALLPLVALLNFFIICGGDLLEYLNPLKARASPQTINFRKAAKQARRDSEDRSYRHKCSVCGKTDSEFPDMEFRYCSRCSGYHCFCIDHINSHIHFN